MSLVVAFKEGNRMVVAGDTRVFSGEMAYTDGITKYITTKNFIMGVCGTTYFIYAIKQILLKPEFIDYQINSTDDLQLLLNVMKKSFKEEHFAEGDDGDDGTHTYGIEILVATNKGELYFSGGYLGATKHHKDFCAIGLPKYYAMGIMSTLQVLSDGIEETDIPMIFHLNRELNIYIGPNVTKTYIEILPECIPIDNIPTV